MAVKRANPLIWGAVAAIVVAGLATVNQLIGMPPSSNPLLNNPFSAIAGTFFWGWVAGHARNWYADRNRLR